MSIRRWSVLSAPVAAVTALVLLGCAPSAPPDASSPTAPASHEVTPTPATAPAPSPTAAPAAPPTCDAIVTPAFAETLIGNGWVSWSLPRDGVGGSPFDVFPGGAPDGSIACRYGADPDLPTDNVLDLAWSPAIADPAAVQAALESEGWVTIDVDGGFQLVRPTPPELQGDADGLGEVFAFGAGDIRHAWRRDQLDSLRDPRG